MFETPRIWRLRRGLGRRQLIKGTAVAGLGLVLAACGPPAQPTPTEPRRPSATASQGATAVPIPSPTTPPSPQATSTAIPSTPTPVPRVVTIWTADPSTALTSALGLAVRKFSGQNPHYQVTVVGGQSDYGKIIQSLALTLGPDVIDPGALAPYATRGVLRALDGYVSAGSAVASNYSSIMWANGQWQGKTYGVPALDHGPELGLLVNRGLVGGNSPNLEAWDKLFGFGLANTKKDGQGISILGPGHG